MERDRERETEMEREREGGMYEDIAETYRHTYRKPHTNQDPTKLKGAAFAALAVCKGMWEAASANRLGEVASVCHTCSYCGQEDDDASEGSELAIQCALCFLSWHRGCAGKFYEESHMFLQQHARMPVPLPDVMQPLRGDDSGCRDPLCKMCCLFAAGERRVLTIAQSSVSFGVAAEPVSRRQIDVR